MKPPEKWVRMRLWMTHPYTSGRRRTWTIFHKNNPIGVNKDPNLDYQTYVIEIDDLYHTSREAVVDATEFNKLVSDGNTIKIPLIGVGTGMGLDGQLFGIEVPNGIMGFGDYRISWFMGGPREWKPIIEWYDKMVEFLTVTLDKQNV